MASQVSTHIDPNRVLRIQQVLEIVGVSRASIYTWMNHGEFPHGIKLGRKAVGWRATDIYDWLNDRSNAHSKEALS